MDFVNYKVNIAANMEAFMSPPSDPTVAWWIV
jgi:hypothetical protein